MLGEQEKEEGGRSLKRRRYELLVEDWGMKERAATSSMEEERTVLPFFLLKVARHLIRRLSDPSPSHL